MGLADALIKLGLTYGSDHANEFCERLMRITFTQALIESDHIGEEYGAYAQYDPDIINSSPMVVTSGYITEHLRNSQLLTIAPTGTISTMLGVSGGAEPIFANSYQRTTKTLHGKDTSYTIYTPIVKKYMDMTGITDEEDLPEYFVTAHQLDYMDRIRCQAALQKWIDASISSTINMANDVTVEDVEKAYIYAWESGCKGITIFRNGCARTPILSTDSEKKEDPVENESKTKTALGRGDIVCVDDNVIGLKRKLQTGCGTLHCMAYFDPTSGDLLETYLAKGSSGGCINSLTGLSRMISAASRGGVPLRVVLDQLKSCGSCSSYVARTATKHDTSKGACCPSAVAYALQEMADEIQNYIGVSSDATEASGDDPEDYSDDWLAEYYQKKNTKKHEEFNGELCPQCGYTLAHEGGCVTCKACGWSRCG